jgi:hypothetical protein
MLNRRFVVIDAEEASEKLKEPVVQLMIRSLRKDRTDTPLAETHIIRGGAIKQIMFGLNLKGLKCLFETIGAYLIERDDKMQAEKSVIDAIERGETITMIHTGEGIDLETDSRVKDMILSLKAENRAFRNIAKSRYKLIEEFLDWHKDITVSQFADNKQIVKEFLKHKAAQDNATNK